uniref:Uncharacterized protein n=1 Tax=Triticum urartu TaxID=4572 RepID=A0A8R7QUR1_TRIUA
MGVPHPPWLSPSRASSRRCEGRHGSAAPFLLHHGRRLTLPSQQAPYKRVGPQLLRSSAILRCTWIWAISGPSWLWNRPLVRDQFGSRTSQPCCCAKLLLI